MTDSNSPNENRPATAEPEGAEQRRASRTARSAAATTAAKAAKARRKRRMLQVQIGLGLIALLIVGVAVAAILARSGGDASASAVPSSVTSDGAFVLGNPDAGVTLTLIEDFQCPACKNFEQAAASVIDSYIASGNVRVEYKPMAFLDQMSTTDYSTRALNVSACLADDAGLESWKRLHDSLFAIQPAEGTAGLDDETLVGQAVAVGGDEAAIERCQNDLAWGDWAESTTKKIIDSGVTSTPTVLLDGEPLAIESEQQFTSAIDAAIAAASR